MSFLSSTLPWGVVSEFESYFFRILLQLVAIIVVARFSGWCFVRIGQPTVVGEIVGGLAIGPSLLGRFAPDFSAVVFDTNQADVLHVISEIGLVLLMFLVGLEFDFSHLRHVGNTAVRIAVAGVVFPFVAGSALAWWMHPRLAEEVNRTGFVLIVAIAMSITAIPILGRIMIELGIQRSALGTLTISAAAIDDVCGWILLALASAVVQGDLRWTQSLYIAMNTTFFIGACYWLASRWFVRWIPRLMVPQRNELTHGGLAVLLVLVLLAAGITNRIGIFSIFGPLVLGASLSSEVRLRDAVRQQLHGLVFAFFLPIFFTNTGLRTDIGLLAEAELWCVCGLVIVVATLGKLGGCGVAAWFSGLTPADAISVAVMMNTRALMGLIAINAGRQMNVIPDNVFAMLVIMSISTTLLTTPLLRRSLRWSHMIDRSITSTVEPTR